MRKIFFSLIASIIFLFLAGLVMADIGPPSGVCDLTDARFAVENRIASTFTEVTRGPGDISFIFLKDNKASNTEPMVRGLERDGIGLIADKSLRRPNGDTILAKIKTDKPNGNDFVTIEVRRNAFKSSSI